MKAAQFGMGESGEGIRSAQLQKPEQNSVSFCRLGINSEDHGISVQTLRVAEVSRPRMPSLDLLELWKWLKSHPEGLSSV